jgi:hypothetical protein
MGLILLIKDQKPEFAQKQNIVDVNLFIYSSDYAIIQNNRV